MASEQTGPLPLSGVRVVDLTRNLAGPYCTMMLGDMGAEVIKVEIPDGGDELRRLFRFPGRAEDSEDYFGMWNRNKRSLAVDLKKPTAMRALLRLIDEADVFVHNMRIGAAARLGLDYGSLSNAILGWSTPAPAGSAKAARCRNFLLTTI